MERSERKAAVSAYKERKAIVGVYAVRCAATDEQWVGGAPDLSTIWTRRTFALRQGIETNRALESAWNVHGPESFAQGADCALARNVGRRGRDLTSQRRLLP
jgi:hypothetical protein